MSQGSSVSGANSETGGRRRLGHLCCSLFCVLLTYQGEFHDIAAFAANLCEPVLEAAPRAAEGHRDPNQRGRWWRWEWGARDGRGGGQNCEEQTGVTQTSHTRRAAFGKETLRNRRTGRVADAEYRFSIYTDNTATFWQ